MNYLSCADAAKAMGITVRRIQQMCKSGEIPGVFKEGRSWLIPENSVLLEEGEKKKPLPIGVSDFKVATTNYYYVDKTLLIRDFLDTKPLVSLFTRPRRFGKTLNMDMFRAFFEKTQENTSIYFRDKKIWQCGNNYTRHQGQYPVIFLTFKDVKCRTWEDTFQKIGRLISLEFIRHRELETSLVLSSYEKEQYHRLASENANEVDYQMGLQLLSMLLHKHYSKECIIIIDEYDTPIQQGHSCNFYSEIVNFIPNKEIAFVYEKEILNRTNQNGVSVSISQAVFSGNAQKLQDLLEDFMLRSISSMDGANEGFYHGMMLGLCAVLGNRYRIRSNREAGLGRFDIQLSPLVSGIPGFLFEFKHTKDERVNLAVLADSALQQINEKKYDTELRNAGVNSIIKIGIAFRGKNAVVKRG